jgi:hypothetical protein
MGREVERHNWQEYLKEFNERNRWRMSQLSITRQAVPPQIERDLSLSGICVRLCGDGAPQVEISLASQNSGTCHLTRSIGIDEKV